MSQSKSLTCHLMMHQNTFYLHIIPAIKYDANLINHMAIQGNLPALKYLHEQHGSWNETLFVGVLNSSILDQQHMINQNACLEYALQHACPRHKKACILAVKANRLSTLKLLRQYHCAWNHLVCVTAIKYNFTHILQWLLKNEGPMHKHVLNTAAFYGRTECMAILRAYHYRRWSTKTCAIASLHGHVACLQYLHQHHCPWNEQTCVCAIQRDQIACLKYAIENGCKWSKNLQTLAYKYGKTKCIAYFKSL